MTPEKFQGLKPYAVLECPNIEDIRKEVLAWVHLNTDFFTDTTNIRFDRLVNYKELARNCPSLVKFAAQLRVPFRDLQFGVMTEARRRLDPLPLHVGEEPQSIKINIPICNTENSVTEWFDVPEEVQEQYPMFRREFYTDAEHDMRDLRALDPIVHEHYAKIGEYHMVDNPVVFNAYIPHRARFYNIENTKLPRILLSIIPIKEDSLVHFLK